MRGRGRVAVVVGKRLGYTNGAGACAGGEGGCARAGSDGRPSIGIRVNGIG